MIHSRSVSILELILLDKRVWAVSSHRTYCLIIPSKGKGFWGIKKLAMPGKIAKPITPFCLFSETF
jgi:hypothetical protein